MVAWSAAPGVSLSLTFGRAPTAGWFPLAPREVYVPFYRSSPDYVRRVNRAHVTHIDNVDVIVRRPHDAGRHTRYVHRDFRRDTPHAAPPRPLTHSARVERSREAVPQVRKPHRDEYGDRGDRDYKPRREARNSQPEARPQARTSSPEKRPPPYRAFAQSAPPTLAAGAVRREAREPERRPDAQRHAASEDDPRKRRQRRDGDERR